MNVLRQQNLINVTVQDPIATEMPQLPKLISCHFVV